MVYKTLMLLILACLVQSDPQKTSNQPVTLGSVTPEMSDGTTMCAIGNRDCSTLPSEPLSSTVSSTDPIAPVTSGSSTGTHAVTTSSPVDNVTVSATDNGTVSDPDNGTAAITTPSTPTSSASKTSTTNLPSTTKAMSATTKAAPASQTVSLNVDPETELKEGTACTCDLTVRECEINCCCDPDCNKDQLAVFSKCLPRPRPLFDDRMCHSMKLVVINNTERLVEENRPGAFCIVKTNLAAWVIHPTRPALMSQTNFRRTWSRAHTPSWPEVGTRSQILREQKPYVQDTILWKFHPIDVLSFDVPTASATSVCSSKRPVRFLSPWSKSCVQKIPEDDFECGQQGADYFLQRLNIVKNPMLVNRTQLTLDKVTSCPKKLCAPVSSFVCSGELSSDEKFSSCKNVSNTALSSFDRKTKVCNGIVRELRLVVHHNGTEGISFIFIYFSLVNMSTAHPGLLRRSYSVDFKWNNHKHKDSYPSNETEFHNSSNNFNLTKRSGHPGYLVGKPVLAGIRQKLEEPAKSVSDPVAKKTDTKQIRERIRLEESPKGWLSVHGPGRCSQAQETRYAVLFGEDLHVSCGLALMKNNFSSAQNCNDLRVKVLQLLLDHAKTKQLLGTQNIDSWAVMIGTFGDADPSDVSDWIPLIMDGILDMSELSRAQNRSASDEASSETLKCDNVVTAMEIRILHSLVGSITNPQSKIIGASVRFESSHDLSWSCDSDPFNCEQQLILTSSVKFVDVSSPAVAHYAEPPGIRIRLPPDFFYPFMVAGNSKNNIRSNSDVTALCLIILVCTSALYKEL